MHSPLILKRFNYQRDKIVSKSRKKYEINSESSEMDGVGVME